MNDRRTAAAPDAHDFHAFADLTKDGCPQTAGAAVLFCPNCEELYIKFLTILFIYINYTQNKSTFWLVCQLINDLLGSIIKTQKTKEQRSPPARADKIKSQKEVETHAPHTGPQKLNPHTARKLKGD